MQMVLPVLRDADVFYNLSAEQLERIAAICTMIRPSKGTILLRENCPGDEMYLISSGSVDVLVDPAMLGLKTDAAPTTVATLRRGQTFGEVVLVDEGLRSAIVRVAEDNTVLLSIRRDDLIRLCEQDYELGYLIMRNIAADLAFKIRSTDLMVREQSLWHSKELGETPTV
jgi:CRP/FNR family cyclic AMP-dependent transcriptional regulator